MRVLHGSDRVAVGFDDKHLVADAGLTQAKLTPAAMRDGRTRLVLCGSAFSPAPHPRTATSEDGPSSTCSQPRPHSTVKGAPGSQPNYVESPASEMT